MSGPGFVIELDSSSYSRRLGVITHHAAHLQPAFEAIHRSFLGIETYQFTSQGALSGGWAPLSEGRLRTKVTRGLDPRILQATHALRESLTRPSSPGHVFRMDHDSVTMGTRVSYAAPLDHPRRAGMPARPLVEITHVHIKRWADIIQNWVFRTRGPE